METPPRSATTIRPADPRSPQPARPPQTAAEATVAESSTGRSASATEPLRIGPLVVTWLAIVAAGIAVVLVALGPVSEERDQRALLEALRSEIESASNEAFGLAGIEVPTEAPSLGAGVGIIDVERLGLSRVVVEGTGPAQTRQGPGHVVGTGGLGQPGNSVVVGRRSLFGGAFSSLDRVAVGDRILVTTDQGRSVYRIDHVGEHAIVDGDLDADSAALEEPVVVNGTDPDAAAPDALDPPASPDAAGDDGGVAPAPLPDGPVTAAQVFGPSPDDRVTLVTSASGVPWAAGDAQIVVARMETEPFTPTPQGGRTAGNDGRQGAPGIPASLVLALMGVVAAVAGGVWLHRALPWRTAYLLSAPVLIALIVVVAEELTTVVPAWA